MPLLPAHENLALRDATEMHVLVGGRRVTDKALTVPLHRRSAPVASPQSLGVHIFVPEALRSQLPPPRRARAPAARSQGPCGCGALQICARF